MKTNSPHSRPASPLTPSISPPTLLGETRRIIRLRQLSQNTEKQYLGWIRRFLRFHNRRHPREVGSSGVEQFLSHLANDRKVAPATQNQALNALIFLYRNVLAIDLGQMNNITWAKVRKSVPVVLTPNEVSAILDQLRFSRLKWLIASLLYGTGMRLIECLRLHIEDINFDRQTITIRNSKGHSDRIVPLPRSLVASVRTQLKYSDSVYSRDQFESELRTITKGRRAKHPPQFLFPSYFRNVDSPSGELARRHLYEGLMQDALSGAVARTGIKKRVSCHTLRHSFATHLLESGMNIREIQQLLGHSSLRSTMIYTHITEAHISRVISPLDSLLPKENFD